MTEAKKRMFDKVIEKPLEPTKEIPRESERADLISNMYNEMTRIKQKQENQKEKQKRAPRFSQANPSSNSIGYRSPQNFNQTPKFSHTLIMSPRNHEKGFQKCDSTTLLSNNQMIYPRSPLRNNRTLKQFKNNDGQKYLQKKQCLNVIEHMVNNYLGSNEKPKPQKSPRYSEPAFFGKPIEFVGEQQVLRGNSKSNESHLEPEKTESADKSSEKQLKQTISTVSSLGPRACQDSLKITDFEFLQDLGKGKYGSVKLAIHKKTGLLFSIKIMKKASIIEENILEQLINEIKFQSFINHSNIVKLYSIIHDRLFVYLIMEACVDGNLYSYMRKAKIIKEKQASGILKSVAEALAELHEFQIIHRDLKPENIVMCYGMSKICDFGWSAIKASLRQTFCGTPLYVSPELLRGCSYDQKIDLWALGIIGYQMMNGKIPFSIRSELDLFRIIESKIEYPKSMSQSAISCLSLMLQKDPEKRSSIDAILNHPFLK